MSVIHTGKLPKIGEKVKSITIEDGGFTIFFEDGAEIFTHAYTSEREYVSYRPSEGLNIPPVEPVPVNEPDMVKSVKVEILKRGSEAGQPGY